MEKKELEDSLASHAWSMASLKPGNTYELASFPVPPDQGSPPTFQVTLNSRGVRDREFNDRPRANTIRIIAIGDSTTFGTGLKPNERFTAHLQQRLDQEFPKKYEVLNCGKAGMSAQAGREFYERQVRAWSPSILIVGLGTNNLRNGQDPMQITEDTDALDSYQNQLELFARQTASDGVTMLLWTNSVLDGRGENTLQPFNSRARLVAEKYALKIVDLETLYRNQPATPKEQAQHTSKRSWTSYWPEFSRVPKSKSALYNDMAHPNSAGFRRLADALFPLVLGTSSQAE
jgi:lysophospholipase L1-like esterase